MGAAPPPPLHPLDITSSVSVFYGLISPAGGFPGAVRGKEGERRMCLVRGGASGNKGEARRPQVVVAAASLTQINTFFPDLC